jgi:hypothetical protein
LLAGFVVLPFALVNTAWSVGVLPTTYLFGAYVLAATIGMGATNLATRHALVGVHPISPVVVLGTIGVLLLGISVPHDPFGGFYTWFVSWWMPAVILGVLGFVRLVVGMVRKSGRTADDAMAPVSHSHETSSLLPKPKTSCEPSPSCKKSM